MSWYRIATMLAPLQMAVRRVYIWVGRGKAVDRFHVTKTHLSGDAQELQLVIQWSTMRLCGFAISWRKNSARVKGSGSTHKVNISSEKCSLWKCELASEPSQYTGNCTSLLLTPSVSLFCVVLRSCFCPVISHDVLYLMIHDTADPEDIWPTLAPFYSFCPELKDDFVELLQYGLWRKKSCQSFWRPTCITELILVSCLPGSSAPQWHFEDKETPAFDAFQPLR